LEDLRLEGAAVEELPEEVPQQSSPLFEHLKQHNVLEKLTNFDEETNLRHHRLCRPQWAKQGGRGRNTKISHMDHELLYKMFVRSGDDPDKISGHLRGIVNWNAQLIRDALIRVRPVLEGALKEEWWSDRIRPTPLTETSYPYIGLLFDETPCPCYRPLGTFNEAKQYWDSHYPAYCLKAEVAVRAHAPHYALFVGPATIGSVHCYETFKRNYEQYIDYLVKTPEETTSVLDDTEHRWAILGDLGYCGPQSDTPEIRKVTGKKSNAQLSYGDRVRNVELAKIRVPIEQFFGRQKRLFMIWQHRYQLEHSLFIHDFIITVLLTNEHIRSHALQPDDRDYYVGVLVRYRHEYEEKVEKRKIEQRDAQQRKRASKTLETTSQRNRRPSLPEDNSL